MTLLQVSPEDSFWAKKLSLQCRWDLWLQAVFVICFWAGTSLYNDETDLMGVADDTGSAGAVHCCQNWQLLFNLGSGIHRSV